MPTTNNATVLPSFGNEENRQSMAFQTGTTSGHLGLTRCQCCGKTTDLLAKIAEERNYSGRRLLTPRMRPFSPHILRSHYIQFIELPDDPIVSRFSPIMVISYECFDCILLNHDEYLGKRLSSDLDDLSPLGRCERCGERLPDVERSSLLPDSSEEILCEDCRITLWVERNHW